MKIQSDTQLLGVRVRGLDGHRLGRVVAVFCAPDPYTPAWFVLRVRGGPGRRSRRWRAVPAGQAHWSGDEELLVPYRRDQVRRSPALPRVGPPNSGQRESLEAFYAAYTPAA